MKKADLKNIIAKLKEGTKVGKKPVAPEIKTQGTYRVRDMRQEAMDMGSHGSEAFKENQSNG